MTLAILQWPLFRAWDANGLPLAGGKLYAYQAGTSTPQALLAADGTTPLANPVVLDASGQAAIRLGANAYKLDLFSALDVHQASWPVDNVTNQSPLTLDDYSATLAQMRLTTDPGEVGTESLATTLAGELERLRYAAYDTKHFVDPLVTQWYQTPTTRLPFVSVTHYGALGDGTTDDTAAIQAAIDSGASTVFFPDGTYLLGTITAGPTYLENRFLTLRSNLTLLGTRGSILKIKDHVLDGATDATANANVLWGTGLTNLHFEGFTINGNGATNLTPVGHIRNAKGIAILGGAHVTIAQVTFLNMAGHNNIQMTRTAGQLNTNLLVRGCTSQNGGLWVGVSNPNNADFSHFYTEWDNSRFLGNYLTQDNIDYGMNGSRGGIEIHASRGLVQGNVIIGALPAVWATSLQSGAVSASVEDITIAGNVFYNCRAGVYLVPTTYAALKRVKIVDNTIALQRSSLDSTGYLVGIASPNGASQTTTYTDTYANGGPTEELTIAGNTIVSLLAAGDTTYQGIGIAVHSLWQATLTGNLIRGMPTQGILLDQSAWGTNGLTIAHNTLLDCGRNAAVQASRAGVYLEFNAAAPVTPSTKSHLKDLWIHHNTVGNTHTETFDSAGTVLTISSTGKQFSGVTVAGLSTTDLVENLVIEANHPVNLPHMIYGGTTPEILELQHNEAHYSGRVIASSYRPLVGRRQVCAQDLIVYPDKTTNPILTDGWISTKTGTGSGTAGSATFVVVDATELRVGMDLTLTGAGGGGSTLVTRILAISSTTLTLATTLGTTVAGTAFAVVTPTYGTSLIALNLATDARVSAGVANYALIGGTVWHLAANGSTLVQVTNIPDGTALVLVASTPTVTIVYGSTTIRLAGAVNYVLSDSNYSLTVYARSGVLIETARAHAQ
jgi:hypothetical protein